MKREIKFRAWNESANRYSLPFGLKSNVLNYTDNDGLGVIKSLTNEIVEQYIGIKSKDGKEIYEGDVIEYIGKIGVVFFKTKGSVGFCLNVKKEGIYGLNSNDKYKIIGNIHQNKDLIK